jgi:hypothetical protein
LRAAEELIRAELIQQPAMILAALCERVTQAGHPQVTTKTMCLELKRLKLPLKKSLQASERDSEQVKGLGTEFARRRLGFALTYLKF